MITIVELAFSDAGHVPFNAGLLEVVRKAFPSERMCFFGGPAHIEELKKQIGKNLTDSIEWNDIKILSSNISYLPRLLGEFKLLQSLLQLSPEASSGPLLLTSARPATLVALKWLKKFQIKTLKAQVVLHGHLSGVSGNRHRHPLRRFQEMRTALTMFGNKNLQYLVLEKNLRNVIVQHLPYLTGNVEVLEHPLPPNEVEIKPQALNHPIRFGFLGLANEAKGFPVFVKLAEEITLKNEWRVEFHAIGRLSSEEKRPLNLEILTTKPGTKRLNRGDYIQRVEQLHYIIFTHNACFYDLNSSGTLLDALALGKPLIARKIAIFENFFAKHGDIGFLFKNDKELNEIVEHILQKEDPEHYSAQVHNLQKARWARSPEALAVKYRHICERMKNQE